MSEHDTPTTGAVAEVVDIHGPVDVAALQDAIRRVVAEAGAVRLSASAGPSGAREFTDGGAPPLTLVDLGDRDDPAAAADDWVRAELASPDAGSRSAQALLRLADDRYRWFHRHPRAVLDGYGCALVSRRAAEVYTARDRGTDPERHALVPHDRFLADEAAALDDPAREADAAYWRERFADRPRPVSLPPADPAPGAGGTGPVALGAAASDRVRAAARYSGAHPRAVLVAAVAAYLHRVTGAVDVVLGLPVDGRPERAARRAPAAVEDVVALRLEVRPDTPFAELVRQAGRESRRARRHQRFRHARVRAELGLAAGARLYEVVADVREPEPPLWFGDHPAVARRVGGEPSGAVRFTLEEDPTDRRLRVTATGPADRHPRAGLDAHARRFATLLTSAVAGPGRTVGALDPLDTGETATAPATATATATAPASALPSAGRSGGGTLTALLDAAAARTPDAVAVRHRADRLTYRELHERAARLARLLIRRGAGPERVVGLLLPRSADAVVAMLAVLKTGAAYLPLDPAYPDERLRLTTADAAPCCLLTDTRGAARDLGARTGPVLVLDDPSTAAELAAAPAGPVTDAERTAPLLPDHPAYVIHTSGSTGVPKGVVVPHRALPPLLAWAEAEFGAALGHSLAATSFSFDVSVAEVFGPLSTGGTVEVVNDLLALLDGEPPRWSGGLLCAVPSVLGKLLSRSELRLSARALALGGEALPADLAARLAATLPDTRLLNVYGPTEATVYATVWRGPGTPDGTPDGTAPPIGRPLDHVRAYVLDEALRPVEPGREGELYLAGEGLARGYLGRPALTADRFTADPFGPPGSRMYRTGDLARQRPDGQLDFLGRADAQLKVNGFRVEPGEVEAVLIRHPRVAEALVRVGPGRAGDVRLLAHPVPVDPAAPPSVAELKGWLAARLPAHLVPAEIHLTAALPRTPSGKLDRRTEPAPLAVPPSAPGGPVAATAPEAPAVAAAPAPEAPAAATASAAPASPEAATAPGTRDAATAPDTLTAPVPVSEATPVPAPAPVPEAAPQTADRPAAAPTAPVAPAAGAPVAPVIPAAPLDLMALPGAPASSGAPGTAGDRDGDGRTPDGGSAPSREDLVAAAFAEVLREPSVPRDQSFFDLGGDSIMSIQLVSHLRQSGLVLTPQDVFEHKTVQALAQAARETAAQATGDGIAPVGGLPLTPIVHWLRDQGGPVDGFHQAVLLRVPATLRQDRLTAAVQALIDHHHAFRLRLDRSAPGWALEVQPVGSVPAAVCVRRVAVDGATGEDFARLLMRETRRAQGELDVEAGHLVRVVWFDAGPATPGRLLFMANHLACDGVSWRIIVPDLVGAYQDVSEGRRPRLRPVETSLRAWSTLLAEQAATPERLAELPLWEETLAVPGPRFARRPLDTTRDTTSTARSRTAVYAADRARHLFTTIPATFHCEINDVLLTALALAVQRVLGTTEDVVIDVEGHGREPVVPGADLSRTIGWFTSMYPVRLGPGAPLTAAGPPSGPELGRALRRVKEQLRAIPDKGIGFGLLRHLNPGTGPRLASQELRHIGFNYFGRFLLPADGGAEDWSPAPETGMTAGADGDMPLDHPLSINALTGDADGGTELRIAFTWADGILDEHLVDELVDAWFETLDALAAHAVEPGAGGRTPSDFPLVRIDQEQIERLEREYPGLDEVLPLSSLQQGMLYHLLLSMLNSADQVGTGDAPHALYTVQFWLELDGDLDSGAMRAAFRALLDRHRNLGAAFVHTGLPQPVQVFRPGVEAPWREADLSGLTEEERESETERLLVSERARPYEPTRPPLLRLLLIDLGGGRRRLVLSTHHILLDGWSLPVIIGELFAHYRAEVTGAPHGLPTGTPFREYLGWLARVDESAAEDAWRTALDGLTVTRIGAPDPGEPEGSRHLWFSRGEDDTRALAEMARRHGVTIATVLQACWALTLAQETGQSDVVFGSVVSGRPAELPGVETMVGLFINTVPTRVRVDPAETLGDLFVRMQREQTKLLPYQHISLTDIRRITDSGDMFDTMMSFANYPFDGEALREPAPGLELVRASGDDRQHYPLGVVLSHRDDVLTLQIEYRPHLVDADRAARLADRFLALLDRSARDPRGGVGTTGAPAPDRAALPAAPAPSSVPAAPPALGGGTGVLLPLREEGGLPPLFCVHPAAGIAWSYAGLTGALGTDRPVYGLQARGLDGSQVLPGSIAEMAADYVARIREVRPHGPYHLLGWSFGGLVAHEMAVQLQRAGERVGLLAVLDAVPSGRRDGDGDRAPGASAGVGLGVGVGVGVGHGDGDGDGSGSGDGPAVRFGPDHVMRTVLQFFGYDRALWADGEPMTYPRFLETVREHPGLLATFDEAMIETICRVYTNNGVLSRDHVPDRFTGDLLLFAAQETAPEVITELWAPYVDGGKPRAHEVASPHAELGRPGPLAGIAEVIAPVLRAHDTAPDATR
ncbi:amino acid adenylation domain-containing protein [Streptomyces sp. JNUCC 64]